MKKVILVIIIILILSFIPFWNKTLKNGGEIKINTWQKTFMKID